MALTSTGGEPKTRDASDLILSISRLKSADNSSAWDSGGKRCESSKYSPGRD